MYMYISLIDIGLFVLFALAVVLGVYLVFILHQALKTLCHVRGILAAQDESIRQSLSLLPGLVTNLTALSASLSQSAELANTALQTWQEEVASTVEDLRDGLETVTVYSKAIGEIIKAIFAR